MPPRIRCVLGHRLALAIAQPRQRVLEIHDECRHAVLSFVGGTPPERDASLRSPGAGELTDGARGPHPLVLPEGLDGARPAAKPVAVRGRRTASATWLTPTPRTSAVCHGLPFPLPEPNQSSAGTTQTNERRGRYSATGARTARTSGARRSVTRPRRPIRRKKRRADRLRDAPPRRTPRAHRGRAHTTPPARAGVRRRPPGARAPYSSSRFLRGSSLSRLDG